MIFPTKHTNFSKSLLGFGSYVLITLETPLSVDDLWKQYHIDYENGVYPAKQSFDNLLLTLIFLHSINAVNEQNGLIIKCV